MDEIKNFLNKKILYLSNHCSSGNTFFLSLIDGHNEILNLPGYVNLNFFTKKNFFTLNFEDEFINSNPFFFDTSKMSKFDKNHQGLFCLGRNLDESIQLDKNIFNYYWNDFVEKTSKSKKNIFLGLYYAYAKVTKKNLGYLKYIIIYPYDHNNTLSYLKFLGDGKILVLSRNLLNNFYSYKKKQKIKKEIRKNSEEDYFYESSIYLYNACKNVVPLIKKKLNFQIIKLEDLHNYPEKIMRKFCESIKINFNKNILESTFLGKVYNGHSWSENTNEIIKNQGFNPDYHNKDIFEKLDAVERVHILFISFFYSRELDYIKEKEIKFLLKNLLYIIYPNYFEKNYYFKSKSISKFILFFKIRIKFIFVFILQRLFLNKIRQSKLEI